MTDESDATIIKNGINGAVAGIGGGGGGGGVGVVATTATAIHVSRGNAINLSSGSGSSAGGTSANSQRMQYTSGGCPSAGSELSAAQSNQESSATAHVNSSGNSNSVESVRSPNTGYGGRLQFFKGKDHARFFFLLNYDNFSTNVVGSVHLPLLFEPLSH